MTSLTGADVTASLLDALVEVAEAAGASEQTDALIGRLGERIARSLAARCPESTDDAAALSQRIETLAAQLLPGSRLRPPDAASSTAGSSTEIAVCLPLPDPSALLDGTPPTRVRLVASALEWLAAQPAGQARVRLDLRLIAGETCWLQTISLCTPEGNPLPQPVIAPGLARERGATRSQLPSPAHGGGGPSSDVLEADHREARFGELAAGVAHGLNNLLGAVAGESSLLLDAADGADAVTVRASGLRLIHQAALDGASLAQRLLRASRGEPADGPDALELVDLGRVLVDAVDLTRLRWDDEARRHGIRIAVAVEVREPLLVRGVAADLREIVVNLILNAVDAMPAGGQLRLCGDLHDGVVTVRCQDTGAGMSPDVLARVFEPFFTTKGSAGTGMGLAILYGVVARHGGEARVSSSVGAGTTISLQLPAAQLTRGVRGPGRAAGRTVSAPLVDLGPDLEALSVLVVEDDPSFRAVFARRLALDARRVEAVADAESALTLLELGGWDLVCVDEGLPDASGRQLAAEIDRGGLAAAVILVTGSATGPDDPSLASVGVDAVLPKPCSDAELARAVRAAAARLRRRLAAPA